MIDRALPQHTGPAPHVVDQHLGRPPRACQRRRLVLARRPEERHHAARRPPPPGASRRSRSTRTPAPATARRPASASVVAPARSMTCGARVGGRRLEHLARGRASPRCRPARTCAPCAATSSTTSAAKCAGSQRLAVPYAAPGRQRHERARAVPAARGQQRARRRRRSAARHVEPRLERAAGDAELARRDAGSTRPDARLPLGCGDRARQQPRARSRARSPIAPARPPAGRATRTRTSWAAASPRRTDRARSALDVGAHAGAGRSSAALPLQRHDLRRRRAPARTDRRDAGARRDDQARGREVPPHVGDRRQRHHRVAQPVRRSTRTERSHARPSGIVPVTPASSQRQPDRRRPAPARARASGDASTATAPDGAARTSRARRCSAA